MDQGVRPLDGVAVLIVEDEPDIRELLAITLEQAGATALQAADAAGALRVLADMLVSAIVSDIGMPDVDGYAFISQVRRDSRTAAIPAIAVTGFAYAADARRAFAAGYQRHIAKPVDPSQLVATIASLLAAR